MKHIVLAHLSESCNTPAIARDDVGTALGRTRYRGALHTAAQDAVLGPLSAGAAVSIAPRVEQLQLF